jgi:acyl dehydratase
MLRACTDVEWFEDYRLGDTFAGEPTAFTEDDIISFARRYDPQPFHIDRAAAEASHFGGIVASGTHMFATVWGGIIRAGFLNDRAMGADIVQFHFKSPARPGDVVTSLTTVREVRLSTSRPDRGYVNFESEVANQRDEIAPRFTHRQLISTRPRQ